MVFGNGASRATDLSELARKSSPIAILVFAQSGRLALMVNEHAYRLAIAISLPRLKEKEMYSGEKSLRVLVDKWLGPGTTAPVRVMEFSRMPLDRTRYVRVGALGQQERFAIVFFRYDDGTWNVFPPRVSRLAMPAFRLET